MITAEYRKYSLKIDGHAGGIKGSDPVCAAVSALTLTLAENLREAEESGCLRELKLDISDGHADISCVPCAHYRSVIELTFRVIVKGLVLIARHEANVEVRLVD